MDIPKTKTEIQKARKLMLDETIEIYTNHSKRSKKRNTCTYLGTKKSLGCAIGSRIKDKELCKKLDNYLSTGVNNISIFAQLPKLLKSLGQDFLIEIQDLHDTDVYWKKNENNTFSQLTIAGKMQVDSIRNNYNLH